MRGARVAMGASLGALVLGCVALGQAQEAKQSGAPEVKVTDGDRLWENFRREDAVVDTGKFRFELQGITLQSTRTSSGPQVILRGTPAGPPNDVLTNVANVNGGLLNLIGTYGLFTNVEVGGQIQGVLQGLQFYNVNDPTTTVGGVTENANTFGDMWLYGKYRYPVNDNLGVGGGVELRLPTGNPSERTGTGEVGTNPFINARYSDGRWSVGGHVGYQFNNGDLDDQFNWDADAIIKASKTWAIRAEFTGWNYTYGGQKINDAYCSPGIDYYFSEDITIRVQGQAGLTDPAIGWGLGAGAVYTF